MWLMQSITLPLWAYIVSLLLPASYIAKLSKNKIDEKLGNGSDK